MQCEMDIYNLAKTYREGIRLEMWPDSYWYDKVFIQCHEVL